MTVDHAIAKGCNRRRTHPEASTGTAATKIWQVTDAIIESSLFLHGRFSAEKGVSLQTLAIAQLGRA